MLEEELNIKDLLDGNVDGVVNVVWQECLLVLDDVELNVIFQKNKNNEITLTNVYHPIHGYDYININKENTYNDLKYKQLVLLHIIYNDEEIKFFLNKLKPKQEIKIFYSSLHDKNKNTKQDILKLGQTQKEILKIYKLKLQKNTIKYLQEDNTQ